MDELIKELRDIDAIAKRLDLVADVDAQTKFWLGECEKAAQAIVMSGPTRNNDLQAYKVAAKQLKLAQRRFNQEKARLNVIPYKRK